MDSSSTCQRLAGLQMGSLTSEKATPYLTALSKVLSVDPPISGESIPRVHEAMSVEIPPMRTSSASWGEQLGLILRTVRAAERRRTTVGRTSSLQEFIRTNSRSRIAHGNQHP